MNFTSFSPASLLYWTSLGYLNISQLPKSIKLSALVSKSVIFIALSKYGILPNLPVQLPIHRLPIQSGFLDSSVRSHLSIRLYLDSKKFSNLLSTAKLLQILFDSVPSTFFVKTNRAQLVLGRAFIFSSKLLASLSSIKTPSMRVCSKQNNHQNDSEYFFHIPVFSNKFLLFLCLRE